MVYSVYKLLKQAVKSTFRGGLKYSHVLVIRGQLLTLTTTNTSGPLYSYENTVNLVEEI